MSPDAFLFAAVVKSAHPGYRSLHVAYEFQQSVNYSEQTSRSDQFGLLVACNLAA